METGREVKGGLSVINENGVKERSEREARKRDGGSKKIGRKRKGWRNGEEETGTER